METNSTRIFIIRAILFVILSLYFLVVFAQPGYRLLPNRTLLNFSAAVEQNGTELKGTLSGSNTFDKIVIERGSNSSNLAQIGELPVTNGGTGLFPFTFFDNSQNSGVNYYRIRLVNTNHHIMEISNILMVKMDNEEENNNKLFYNTVVQGGSPVLTIKTGKNEEATLQVTDIGGRILYKNKVQLNAGTNNIYMNPFISAQGYGVAVIETRGERKSVKILIQ